jgi:DNA helicase HerA-like ATPase
MRLANRHGLIAGATGTGKTVTLQRLAEAFSDAGVAVFAADIKGDLCGLGAAGNPQGKIAERIAGMPWLNHKAQAYPVTLWDIHGQSGHPLRTTLSEMGPLLMGSLLELTDSQQSALYAAFKVADREGLLLLDLKDLKALLNHLKDNPELLGEDAALMTTGSSQALLRRLATLEQQGAEACSVSRRCNWKTFCNRPLMVVDAFICWTPVVWCMRRRRSTRRSCCGCWPNCSSSCRSAAMRTNRCWRCFSTKRIYLFGGTPKALQDRLEQVVRLIRSKGVGVYFVTQSPGDLPDNVLAQLGSAHPARLACVHRQGAEIPAGGG